MTAFLQPLPPSPLLCPTLAHCSFATLGCSQGCSPFAPYPLFPPCIPSSWNLFLGLVTGAWMEAQSRWPVHQHLFPLAVPVAPGRSPAHKKCLGRAKLEVDCATSIAVSPTPALGDSTAMVHREVTGTNLVCASLGFGLDYWLGVGWEGDMATGLFPCVLLSLERRTFSLAAENTMLARYRNC